MCSCALFKRTVQFSQCFSREPYLYQPVSKVCVCVCVRDTQDSVTPSVLGLFREQSMPVGSVLSFSENSFMPVGNVLSFPENSLYSQCLVKE